MAQKTPGVTHIPGTQPKLWRARYRDAAGKEHQKQFTSWVAARDWRVEQLAAVRAGSWVDPTAGRESLQAYAERWLAGAGLRTQSRRVTETRLRLHVYPALGHRPIADLRHSELRSWLSELERTMAPWSVYGVHSTLRSVLNSAVADRVVARSPFDRIPLRKVKRQVPVVPLTVPQVASVLAVSPPPYGALFALGAATGMRGSELRGLEVSSIDFLRRTVAVRRQLVTAPHGDVRQAHAWGPPKTDTSERTLDVPQWALDVVSAHLAARPAVTVTLPVVDTPRVSERTGALVFTTKTGRPISQTNLHATWNRALVRAGLERAKGQGPHALRHHVASLLIDAGESVKVVQAQLGHASAAETWDTYSHLFPDPEGRVRQVLADAWQAGQQDVGEGHAGDLRADLDG